MFLIKPTLNYNPTKLLDLKPRTEFRETPADSFNKGANGPEKSLRFISMPPNQLSDGSLKVGSR